MISIHYDTFIGVGNIWTESCFGVCDFPSRWFERVWFGVHFQIQMWKCELCKGRSRVPTNYFSDGEFDITSAVAPGISGECGGESKIEREEGEIFQASFEAVCSVMLPVIHALPMHAFGILQDKAANSSRMKSQWRSSATPIVTLPRWKEQMPNSYLRRSFSRIANAS